MARRGFVAAIAWMTAAGAAHAQSPSLLHDPRWLREPAPEEVGFAYPAAARLLGLQGYAALRCGVDRGGATSGCEVREEAPRGLGFGAAVLEHLGALRAVDATREPLGAVYLDASA